MGASSGRQTIAAREGFGNAAAEQTEEIERRRDGGLTHRQTAYASAGDASGPQVRRGVLGMTESNDGYYEIAGRRVRMPCVVRDASAGTATFEADAGAARSLVP